ncbi:DUF6152 family protein [Novosphingobium sp.]|uniref:DUF6152 family protein n=1 Tax=Novosphingobium sp. TaxID=1874826 RepID=UPI003340CEC1
MNRLKMRWLAGLVAGAALGVGLGAAPAVAHHSFAAYDMNQTLSAEGTLKEFRWGAPHSSLVLIYLDKGAEKQMSIISGSPLLFSKQGLSPRDFKRGDKIKVTYHPNTSGQPGGALATLKLPNGKAFSDTEAARAGGN